jgi:hypothetical protein
MPAVAGDFRHILIFRVFAVLAAIFLVAAYGADTNFMPAFIIVRHKSKNLPCLKKN